MYAAGPEHKSESTELILMHWNDFANRVIEEDAINIKYARVTSWWCGIVSSVSSCAQKLKGRMKGIEDYYKRLWWWRAWMPAVGLHEADSAERLF